MSSNGVLAIADPNWPDAMPMRTSASGGSASARRLVLVLERDVLQRVHRAEVRSTGVERRPDLLLGQLRAALGAALLDDRVDSAGFLEVWHQSACLVMTCVTGRPVTRSIRVGRSIFSHFDARTGSVETITSSNSPKLTASCTAASGSESPSCVSTFSPSDTNFSVAWSRCSPLAWRAASGSAAFWIPCPDAGTTSRNSGLSPLAARALSASRSSGDSAVRLATTKTRAMHGNLTPTPNAQRLVGRQICVPVAERAERAPELALGRFVVQRGVDIGAVERLAARRQPLDLAELGLEPPPQRDTDVAQLLERVLAHHHYDARLDDRKLLDHPRAA